MIFLLVAMLAVSTRRIPGRCTICLASTGGGVIATGAMTVGVQNVGCTAGKLGSRVVKIKRRAGTTSTQGGGSNKEEEDSARTAHMLYNATDVRLHT